MAKKSKYNPQGDDDVERGYQKHQKWYKNKEKKEKQKKEKEKEKSKEATSVKEEKGLKSYDVAHTGGTLRQKGLKP